MGIKKLDNIENNCILLNRGKRDESKIRMITKEFQQGINAVKHLDPSVTFYGSARIKNDHPDYIKTYKLAYRIAKELGFIIMSGGGNGIMEAANKGGFDAGVQSIGLSIELPHEQKINHYVTKEIPFHFFFARQVSMDYTTEVCIFCPGGFGTLNELFEVLTLQQTHKIGKIPIILFGSEYWNPLEKFIEEVLLKKYHAINSDDLNIYTIIDDEDEILEIVKNSRKRTGEDSLK